MIVGSSVSSDEAESRSSDSMAPTSTVIGWRRVWKRFRTRISAMIGLGLLLVLVAGAVFASWLAPHDPKATSRFIISPPSHAHWLGTDEVGRDLLSRLFFAIRFSLLASLLAVAVAVVVGALIGLISGYVGGWVDNVLMRLSDAVLAFPGLLLAMGIVGVLGPGLRNAMLGLSVAFMPTFVRLTRGEVLQMREEPYVEAAKVAGVRGSSIIRRHVIPNTRAPILVQTLMTMALALLAEGALSFLGLGVQPPDASLGTLLQRGFAFVDRSPRLILVPGLIVTVLAWCFNAIADGLRDALEVTDTEQISL